MSVFRKPPKIFYGWWIVCAALLTNFYIAGVVSYGFTAVFEPIAEEFAWSYAQISLAASLRGMEVGLLAPLTGILVDRWGPRRLAFAGTLIIAMGLFLLSQVNSLGMYYASFILIAIGTGACTTTVLMSAISHWFQRNIGMASGIVSSGIGFSGLMIPLVVRLIDLYEWRMTMIIFSGGLLVLIMPLTLLFRHKPEQYGYLPDGEAKSKVKPEKRSAVRQTEDTPFGLRRALKTRAYWHMAFASICQVIVVSSVITHIMPYLSSVGLARSVSGFLATAVPLTSIAGRVGLGWLGDRLNRKWITSGALAMMCFGILCFAYVSDTNVWLIAPFYLLFGVGYGAVAVMRPAMVWEYFGRTNFGGILGSLIGIAMLGGIAGPPLAGWVFDNWGSYQVIWLIYAGFGAAATIVMAGMPSVNAKNNRSTQ